MTPTICKKFREHFCNCTLECKDLELRDMGYYDMCWCNYFNCEVTPKEETP